MEELIYTNTLDGGGTGGRICQATSRVERIRVSWPTLLSHRFSNSSLMRKGKLEGGKGEGALPPRSSGDN